MSTFTEASNPVAALRVKVTARLLIVELRDGRTVSVPIEWYPRLANATPGERQGWELIGPGIGIHWPKLDEDISVEGLLRGLPSGESSASLQQWLEDRRRVAHRRVRPATAQGRRRATSARRRRLHGSSAMPSKQRS
jgi:hypothetical protein